MIPEPLSTIANHLWQSTLIAGFAGLLTLALRKNTARLRYWVWVCGSVKFLVPFSFLMAIGGRLEWRTAPVIAPNVSLVMHQVSQPFSAVTVSTPVLVTAPPAPNLLLPILIAVWLCGLIGIATSWFLRLWRVSGAVRAGSPVELGLGIQAVSSPAFLEPGIFGLFRQVLLLPDGILEHLSPQQWRSVVAHELCHARHRDNLIAAVQMLIEAVFWFHPLVWWVGERIFQERERACDEEVLRLGNEPRTYAEGILKVCELYLESPVACIAGVSGSNVRKRIQEIMSRQVGVRLTVAGRVILATAAVAAVSLPIAVGLLHPAALRAQSTAPSGPKFAVASIKPVTPDSDHFMFGVRPMPGGAISAANVTLKFLIQSAYGLQDYQVSGGPGWMETERYNIEAKPDSPTGFNVWREMLKSLLADRFQLTFHRETKEFPAYALVLARKDGKLGPGLVESKEGACTVRDPSKPPGPPVPGQLPYCGNVLGGASQLNGTAAIVGDIIPQLSRILAGC